jgi:hypothetical protein
MFVSFRDKFALIFQILAEIICICFHIGDIASLDPDTKSILLLWICSIL